ncbi:MAG: RNA pseudouridine synthase [Candidatus Alcyoniella australis]|nr:RNA pseudouridine synthase [Candidatus Alcyoniella australis]
MIREQGPKRERPAPLPGIRLLYCDDDLVVADKDAGLLSDPGRDKLEGTLLDLIEIELGYEVLPVHRLERWTSGVTIVARHEQARSFLERQFQEQQVGELYLAIVSGAPPAAATIDLPLRAMKARGSVDVRTQMICLERFARHAMVACRTNGANQTQVREHLAAAGFTLLGDAANSGERELLLSSIKRGYRSKSERPERPLISRQALHCARLEIKLPASDLPQAFEAPQAADFALALKMLRKYSA